MLIQRSQTSPERDKQCWHGATPACGQESDQDDETISKNEVKKRINLANLLQEFAICFTWSLLLARCFRHPMSSRIY